jgi:hypothetical protein
VARAAQARVTRACAHDVPLVKAREDHRGLGALAPGTRRRLLDEHERLDQLHPCVAMPDVTPDVLGRVTAAGRRRVACFARVAGPARPSVEGQGARVRAIQARRHVCEVRVEREMHECAPPQQETACRPVAAVLADRVIDRLIRVPVLELGGGRGEAVDEEHEVEAVSALRVEPHLAHDAKLVVLVEDPRRRLDLEIGLEVRQPQRDTLLGDAAAEHRDRAALVELRCHPSHKAETRVGVRARELDELVPMRGPAWRARTR